MGIDSICLCTPCVCCKRHYLKESKAEGWEFLVLSSCNTRRKQKVFFNATSCARQGKMYNNIITTVHTTTTILFHLTWCKCTWAKLPTFIWLAELKPYSRHPSVSGIRQTAPHTLLWAGLHDILTGKSLVWWQ